LHGKHYRRADALAQDRKHRYADDVFQWVKENDAMETIGSRIRLLRTSQRLTQIQLADLLDIKQNTLSELETGKSVLMSAPTLEAICRVLVTTPSFVLYGVRNGESAETAMMEAELTAIFREMPTQAQEALIRDARLIRSALPATTAAQPLIKDRLPAKKSKTQAG
jgi:transcriptional regulator with XRE-family HTH domain